MLHLSQIYKATIGHEFCKHILAILASEKSNTIGTMTTTMMWGTYGKGYLKKYFGYPQGANQQNSPDYEQACIVVTL